MADYREQVYAGVLGKLIGVFFGRPIEGWPYEKIRKKFDIVDSYVNDVVGTPLHVADDDLAGTFTFLKAAEDFEGNPAELTAKDFGNAWLDYIIEKKTVFWWGGLGRSTEHTAYLRLKAGIPAPLSGQVKTNGQAVAEQIGAQIFMDAYAMMCPDDPELARYLVGQCASVSHDGIAVESAKFLASMEAMAFGEKDLYRLLERGMNLAEDTKLKKIVDSVIEETEKTKGFRAVRQWLEEKYSYSFYPGNCHVIPNLALIIASLILGGDDFGDAMRFCVSAGWDTDCNGANLGCLNGIRLGLPSLTDGYDFRTPVADRFYNISADGGACITDAVQETDRILRQHDRIYHTQTYKKRPRFSFSLPGSVQGFTCEGENKALRNRNEEAPGENGLYIPLDFGKRVHVSTLTMYDTADISGGYELIASPTLYSGQTVHMRCRAFNAGVKVTPYAVFYDFDDREEFLYGSETVIEKAGEIIWTIPENHGRTIKRLGICCECLSEKDALVLESADWDGAPHELRISGSLRNYDMGRPNMQLKAFASSAEQFSFDSRRTFTVSHTGKNGMVVTGTEQWKDYEMECTVIPGLHRRMGLAARCRGLRRYYAFIMQDGREALLVVRKGEEERVLDRVPFAYDEERAYRILMNLTGSHLTVKVDGEKLLEADDGTFSQGGCGFVVDEGTFLADDLIIRNTGNVPEERRQCYEKG